VPPFVRVRKKSIARPSHISVALAVSRLEFFHEGDVPGPAGEPGGNWAVRVTPAPGDAVAAQGTFCPGLSGSRISSGRSLLRRDDVMVEEMGGRAILRHLPVLPLWPDRGGAGDSARGARLRGLTLLG
jgi:hypothetical protein